MDTFDYAQFANQIGGFYQQVAQAMGDYLQNNITTLAADAGQLRIFCDEQSRIISYANTFYALSDKIAFVGAGELYRSVVSATASLNTDIRHIEQVDKWINFSAGVINLGSAIVSRNGGGIVSSVQAIRDALGTKPPDAGAAS